MSLSKLVKLRLKRQLYIKKCISCEKTMYTNIKDKYAQPFYCNVCYLKHNSYTSMDENWGPREILIDEPYKEDL